MALAAHHRPAFLMNLIPSAGSLPVAKAFICAKLTSVRKANHYVAQSYQQRFCDAEGLIWVYDKETRTVKPQHPQTTAVMMHLYTTETEGGEKSDILEREVFAPLDGGILPLIKRWVEPDYRIPENEIPPMSYYLAFQHARVPRTLEMFRELGEKMHVEFIKQMASDKNEIDKAFGDIAEKAPPEVGVTREKVQEWFANFDKHCELKLKDEFVLRTTIMQNVPNYYETFVKMHWSVVEAPRDSFFITCDAPVVSFTRDPYGQPNAYLLGCGTAYPEFEMRFPLSPTVCVLARKVKGQPRIKCGSKKVDEFNYMAALIAERYIFSHCKSAKVMSLLERCARTRGKPKIDDEYVRRRMAYENQHGIV